MSLPQAGRFEADVRRWGTPRATAALILRRLRPWLVLCGVYVRPIAAAEAPTDNPGSIEFRLATREELLAAAAEMPEQLNVTAIEEALDRGELCAAAFDGPHMVSFVWRAFTPAPHVDGLWVGFDKPFRYGYKAYTRPEYRGQHLQNPIRLLADVLSLARGYTRALSFIELHNYSSIAAELRRGNRRVGFAGYLRIFGKTYPFRSRGAKAHTFRFFVPPRSHSNDNHQRSD